jgi:hypothetical protein
VHFAQHILLNMLASALRRVGQGFRPALAVTKVQALHLLSGRPAWLVPSGSRDDSMLKLVRDCSAAAASWLPEPGLPG